MVLAADTELSTFESKTNVPKIMWTKNLPIAGNAPDAFGITGSGPVAYLEAIYQEMQKTFNDNRTIGMDLLEASFRTRLDGFYKAHVIPFSSYPDRPDFWVIIAAERNNQRRMWVSERNVLRAVSGYTAVGAGEMQARALLNNIDLPMDAQTAQTLAAYLIFRVKRLVPGCGMETDVICIRNHDIDGLHRVQVRKLEEVFQQYEVLEAAQLHQVLGSNFEFAGSDRERFLITSEGNQ